MPARLNPPPVATTMLTPAGLVTWPWEQFFQSLLEQRVTASSGLLADIPAAWSLSNPGGLRLEDEGYLYTATDYARVFRWTGTAWERAAGEMPTLFVGLFAAAPGTGWKKLDGTGNPFTYTTATAGTSTITIQDARGYYPKLANAFTGNQVAAVAPGATGPTLSTDATGITGTGSGAASIGNNSANVVVQAGAGTTVAADPHTHSDSGHTHSITDPSHTHTPGAVTVDATGEPQHMDFLPYVRL